MEEELKDIAEKQSFNVNILVEMVKENESILAQMRVRVLCRIVVVPFFGLTSVLTALHTMYFTGELTTKNLSGYGQTCNEE